MCILDFIKALMHDFHYSHVKDKYDDKAKLLFTKIDILVYEIETSDVNNNFCKNKEIFDCSRFL